MKPTSVVEDSKDACRALHKASCSLAGLVGPPTNPRDARRSGRDALRLASELLTTYRTTRRKDPMKLRTACAMTWLALIAACQAIVLMRVCEPTLQGGPADVHAAAKVARTRAEHDIVCRATLAEADLYEAGFMAGDLDADEVACWVRTARAALKTLAATP